MNWPPDIPDIPMKKTHEIEKIERLPLNILNAMTDTEAEEKIRDVANSLAKAYSAAKKDEGSLDECNSVVSSALEQTGSSIGGKLGNLMIAASEHESEQACKSYYPERPFPNELEF